MNFDYSLLLNGEEVLRTKTEPDGRISTRYRSDLGPDILNLFVEYESNIQESNFPYTSKYTIPKILRCHSKKRLRRLLMSYGECPKAASIVAGFAKVHHDVDIKLGKHKNGVSYLQCLALSYFFSDTHATIQDNLDTEEKEC